MFSQSPDYTQLINDPSIELENKSKSLHHANDKPVRDSVEHLLEVVDRMVNGVYTYAKAYKDTVQKSDILAKHAWSFIDGVNDKIPEDNDRPNYSAKDKFMGCGTQACPLNTHLDPAVHAMYYLSFIRNWLIDWNSTLKQTKSEIEQKHVEGSFGHDALKKFMREDSYIEYRSLPDNYNHPHTAHELKNLAKWARNLWTSQHQQQDRLIRSHTTFLMQNGFMAPEKGNAIFSNLPKQKPSLFKQKVKSSGPASEDMSKSEPLLETEKPKKNCLSRIFCC